MASTRAVRVRIGRNFDVRGKLLKLLHDFISRKERWRRKR